MTRFCWWLVDVLSRLLEANDRSAVLADFTESDEMCWAALLGLLGLLVRRQAALWSSWRPWLVLTGLFASTMALSLISLTLTLALHRELLAWWQYGVHYQDGLNVSQEICVCLSWFLAICLWSWAGGFVLGFLSGRAIWLTAPLFVLVVSFPIFRLLSHLYSDQASHFGLFDVNSLVIRSHPT